MSECEKRKESEMLTKTERTLAIYSKRGKQGKSLERIYRELFRPELYRMAYAQTYANEGAITKGTGEETLDGMSEERIRNIIEKVKTEQYKWRPVRRTYIPKKDGRKRPLGIPSGDDKILQTGMKILLEAYYEPTFSNRSHGFRPGKGCHTALWEITRKHQATSWFIEGDIKGCFDNINHETLIGIMEEKIKDGRFISLVRKLLKAGYMENWKKENTYSGTPQGGIISPLLTNIYMDKVDKWVESELLKKHNKRLDPKGRRRNPEYSRFSSLIEKARKEGDQEAAKKYLKMRKNVNSRIQADKTFRKLEYTRYADDFLLSYSGKKKEAEEIKEEIGKFLRQEMKLEMSKEKTLVTHAKSQEAKFLGYGISIHPMKPEIRKITGLVKLSVPKEVITRAMRKYCKKGKPVHRAEILQETNHDIVWQFQGEYRGLVQYYQMAQNVSALSKVGWVTRASLLKTLAHKNKMTVNQTGKKFAGTQTVNGQSYKTIEIVKVRKGKKPIIARFGAVSLARNPKPEYIENQKQRTSWNPRTSGILKRMEAEECEMCGLNGRVESHHVKKLKDLQKQGRKERPVWQKRMIALQRKTMWCCQECHQAIHDGKHLPKWDIWKDTLESRVP